MRQGWYAMALLGAMTPVAYATAAVIGQMTTPPPITAARIATDAPPVERGAWTAYLARSQRLLAADKATLAAERATGAPASAPPTGPSGGGGMPLDRDPAWYATAEARHVADNIVSFQTPAGGWGKNVDRTGPVRVPGMLWVAVENLPAYARGDLAAGGWNYVGTFDNNATTTEIRFLARAQAAAPGREGDGYRAAMLRGVRYVLAAQFPNGGWPQIFPLEGGYHDALTFNDDALTHVVSVLELAAARQGDWAAVPAPLAAEAKAAADRAIAVVLRTQVVVDGKPTVWGQQHDALTLAPVGARNFEPIAWSSTESAALLVFLMAQPQPSPRMVAAIDGGVAWLRAHAIEGQAWQRDAAAGRKLVATPGAPLLWARFYDMGTGKPVFGDRDKTIHDDVQDLSPERRNGYSWYNNGGAKALAAYAKWKAARGG